MSRFPSRSGAPFGALLLLSLSVRAAEPRPDVSISITPPFIEKVAADRTQLSDSLSYTNDGTVPLLVSVDFADFSVSEEGGVSEEPPGSQHTSLVPYLRLSPGTIRVGPGQRVFFRYAVDTPPEFDQLRGMVYFSAVPQVPGAANQVLVVARAGVPLYVENRRSRPAALQVEEPTWERESGGYLILKTATRNTGERNIRPSGFVRVRSKDDTFDKTFDFNEGREPVLPGQRRRWEMTFGPVPQGALSVETRFSTSTRTSYESEAWIPAAQD